MFNATKIDLKRRASTSDKDSVKVRRKDLRTKDRDYDFLLRNEKIWNNFDGFRQRYARCTRFAYGDQLADTIVVNGKPMTYREYLVNTGNYAFQTNQIKNKVDTILGVMVKDANEPVCHAVDRDEQQYGEIMTNALQTNCDKNELISLKMKWLRELALGGMCISRESWDDTSGPARRLDSWTTDPDPNQTWFEGGITDPRHWDMTLIGQFYDRDFNEVCAMFPDKFAELKKIYTIKTPWDNEPETEDAADRSDDTLTFFPTERANGKCRVYEIWTKETRECIRLHDTYVGEEEIVDASDTEYLKQVKRENEARRKLALDNGFSEDEIPYIVGGGFGRDAEERNQRFIETYWYCRLMAPDGTILWEGESPYADHDHPFSFCIFPFVNGQIIPYMYDAVDTNMAINRIYALQEWLIRTQAKGVTVVPKKIVPKDVSFKEFARSWTAIDELVYIDMKPGEEKLMPQVFHGAAQTFNAEGMIATLLRLMDSGTPVNNALQGKNPTSGTSGVLFAQMTNNASTPLAALIESFNLFIRNMLVKKMKNIAMFYDTKRFESIAGRIDTLTNNQNLHLNEVGMIEYDLVIKESVDTPVYRAIIRDDAKEFLMAGLISFEEYLEISNVPYADKIIQERQARQAEAEAAQQGGMTPMGGQTPSRPSAMTPVANDTGEEAPQSGIPTP